MANKDTIIVVGQVRQDEYNNIWVTPKGGGDEVKIAAKRSQLHKLFEQGKAVMLHWETYKGKNYVADAKPVEGELPPPHKPESPSLQEGEEPPIVTEAKKMGATVTGTEPRYKADPAKTQSIERQKALAEAVSWCGYKVQAGVEIKTEDVIKVAEKFLGFISNDKA